MTLSWTPARPRRPPLRVWNAVTRVTHNGLVLGPEQRVDVATALRAHTSDAAFLELAEHRKGTLEPGKLGDVAVVSADPFGVPTEARDRLQVEMTIIGGEVVWERSSNRPA